jgi:hypothetical protein
MNDRAIQQAGATGAIAREGSDGLYFSVTYDELGWSTQFDGPIRRRLSPNRLRKTKRRR